MKRNGQPTAVFDIIGTCFTLDKPREALVRLGAPDLALELWFAQTLRDFFAYSHAGGYAPLRDVLRAALIRLIGHLGLQMTKDDIQSVLRTFTELDARPDLSAAVSLLVERGWRVIALTNGAEESTRALLKHAQIDRLFDRMLSSDSISVTKPNRAVYQLALDQSEGETWMIAGHAWDIAGASRAGLKTAFITSVEGAYLEVYPPPDVVAGSLREAAQAMVER